MQDETHGEYLIKDIMEEHEADVAFLSLVRYGYPEMAYRSQYFTREDSAAFELLRERLIDGWFPLGVMTFSEVYGISRMIFPPFCGDRFMTSEFHEAADCVLALVSEAAAESDSDADAAQALRNQYRKGAKASRKQKSQKQSNRSRK